MANIKSKFRKRKEDESLQDYLAQKQKFEKQSGKQETITTLPKSIPKSIDKAPPGFSGSILGPTSFSEEGPGLSSSKISGVDDIQQRIDQIREQKNKIAKQIKELQAPKGGGDETTPKDEENGGNLTVPPGDEGTSETTSFSALAGFDAANAQLQKLIKKYDQAYQDAQADIKKYEKKSKKWFKKLVSEEEDRKSAQDIVDEKMKEYGVPETYEDIKTMTEGMEPLRNEIVSLKEQKQKELDQLQSRTGSLKAASNQAKEIEREYNRKISVTSAQLQAKSAQAQALQGNISTARAMISDAVNAATYDQKVSFNRMKTFINYNQDVIDNLEQEEQNYMNNALDLSLQQYENAKLEETTKMDLMIEYPQAFEGVNVTDMSLEEVAEIAREGAATQQAEEEEEEEAAIEYDEEGIPKEEPYPELKTLAQSYIDQGITSYANVEYADKAQYGNELAQEMAYLTQEEQEGEDLESFAEIEKALEQGQILTSSELGTYTGVLENTVDGMSREAMKQRGSYLQSQLDGERNETALGLIIDGLKTLDNSKEEVETKIRTSALNSESRNKALTIYAKKFNDKGLLKELSKESDYAKKQLEIIEKEEHVPTLREREMRRGVTPLTIHETPEGKLEYHQQWESPLK